MINPQMLAQVLGQHPGGPGGPPPDQDDKPGTRPPTAIEAVQDCIQDIHELMQVVPDAMHKQMVNQALAQLLKVQSDLMKPQGGAAGAISGQLTG